MTTARGTLYLVPNTLDHGMPGELVRLDDLLPMGVIRVAARLEHWVCENAKATRAFLKRVDATVPLARPLQDIVLSELPRPPKGRSDVPGADAAAAIRPLLAPLLAGHDIGLVSDAGLPALADPGALLVAAAHAADVRVTVLPGASAISLAVAASGLNGQSFAFVGYLPVEATARAQRIRELEIESRRRSQTQVLIETPYRNQAMLDALATHLQPQTSLAVCIGLATAAQRNMSQSAAGWRTLPMTLPADVPAVFAFLAR